MTTGFSSRLSSTAISGKTSWLITTSGTRKRRATSERDVGDDRRVGHAEHDVRPRPAQAARAARSSGTSRSWTRARRASSARTTSTGRGRSRRRSARSRRGWSSWPCRTPGDDRDVHIVGQRLAQLGEQLRRRLDSGPVVLVQDEQARLAAAGHSGKASTGERTPAAHPLRRARLGALARVRRPGRRGRRARPPPRRAGQRRRRRHDDDRRPRYASRARAPRSASSTARPSAISRRRFATAGWASRRRCRSRSRGCSGPTSCTCSASATRSRPASPRGAASRASRTSSSRSGMFEPRLRKVVAEASARRDALPRRRARSCRGGRRVAARGATPSSPAGVPAEKVRVRGNGFPEPCGCGVRTATCASRLGIPADAPVILYVGQDRGGKGHRAPARRRARASATRSSSSPGRTTVTARRRSSAQAQADAATPGRVHTLAGDGGAAARPLSAGRRLRPRLGRRELRHGRGGGGRGGDAGRSSPTAAASPASSRTARRSSCRTSGDAVVDAVRQRARRTRSFASGSRAAASLPRGARPGTTSPTCRRRSTATSLRARPRRSSRPTARSPSRRTSSRERAPSRMAQLRICGKPLQRRRGRRRRRRPGRGSRSRRRGADRARRRHGPRARAADPTPPPR